MRRQPPKPLAPFVPLSTPRLALVALSLEDAPAIFAYASDPEISHLAAWPWHEDIEASRYFVARSMVGYAQGGHYEWGLKRRADQALIGTCGFGEIDIARGMADINYALAKPYWGQGYATEAAASVIQFGFMQLGLQVIEANSFPENTASAPVSQPANGAQSDAPARSAPPTGAQSFPMEDPNPGKEPR